MQQGRYPSAVLTLLLSLFPVTSDTCAEHFCAEHKDTGREWCTQLQGAHFPRCAEVSGVKQTLLRVQLKHQYSSDEGHGYLYP